LQIYFLDIDREKRENVNGPYVTVEQNEKENSTVERRKGKREKPTQENEKGTTANENK
jgi:hypothetical protein